MGRLFACFAALAVALLASSAHAEGKCQRYRLASLPMSLDRSGVPQIPVTVNGQPLNMIIDTGGIDSELTWATVERLKLVKRRLEVEARVYDLEGKPILFTTKVDDFHIGSMFGKDWPFLVMPQETIAVRDPLVDGVISPDILSQYDVEFDFAAGKFALFTHDDCPGRVVYWSMENYGALPFIMDGYHILAHATLDGEAIDVMIDTGSTMSVMTDKVAREIGLDPAKMKRIDNGLDDSRARYLQQSKVLDMNGMRVENPEFMVLPERNGALDNLSRARPTVILGMSALKNLHLYIAYREKVLYFTKADAR